MTFIKLLLLFLFIIFLQQHGIIYRTGKSAARQKLEAIQNSVLPRPENVNGSWRLYGTNQIDPTIMGPEGKAREEATFSKKNLFLSFFPDSTFTQIYGAAGYSKGRWAYDSTSRSIFLTTGRNTQEIGVRFNLAQGGLRVMNLEYSPSESLLMLEYGEPIDRYYEDPFYAPNNWWREKPENAESRGQVLNRLRNYVLHNVYLLKAARTREHDLVSWEFSEGIIRIYNPGIGIVKPDKIPASWTNSFYSEEQAATAYKMFEKQLRKSKIKTDKSKNWVEVNEKILAQLHEDLASVLQEPSK